ncbi:MAG TPA: hypothetical protein PLL69_09340, partial [Gemmatimonadales bacterium]|nr:hypothetical protein [Gemmatimonadales bacterium]
IFGVPIPRAPMQHALQGLVDYAGLFPPTAASMARAVANFAEYRGSAEHEMLGRFVVGEDRLEELGAVAAEFGLLPADHWPLAVVLGSSPSRSAELLEAFSEQFAGRGLRVESAEAKIALAADAAAFMAALGNDLEYFFEVPHAADHDALIGGIARLGAGVKLRTGGVTPESFPSSAQVISFLAAAVRHGVRFKATAGLHHPWRGSHPLTYAPDSPRHVMFGFMNLMLAAALLRAGENQATATAALEETAGGAIVLDSDAIRWRSHEILMDDLIGLRTEGFRSFGSCSFREPVDELAVGVSK